jgi:hypothetical protein
MISSSGYVGLRNLGSTCYMNSLLQQFYMVPEFRCGIIMADDPSEDKSDSLLYQLQTLFGFLTLSHKQAYDTSPFCRSYKARSRRQRQPRGLLLSARRDCVHRTSAASL